MGENYILFKKFARVFNLNKSRMKSSDLIARVDILQLIK